ncbi:hypothetical protein GMRT_15558 [Giardia muris]|uniref:Uncharacterized protein n=1 Tax=Giardia muris TaxID=5742 RepID=A0A4Z1SSW2_GIAMU|nr:hypothetical protein GMRT_15558 [Giardia muris]|eukprot:TNJ28850.1 hypothetical protein GMRT_15558 [Giardia muris]
MRNADTLLTDEVEALTEFQVVGMNSRALGSSVFLLDIPGFETQLKVELPQRFNRTVWFGRHRYAIATLPIPVGELTEEALENEVMGTIDTILTERNIQQMSEQGWWPEEFQSAVPKAKESGTEVSNRKNCVVLESSSSDNYYDFKEDSK